MQAWVPAQRHHLPAFAASAHRLRARGSAFVNLELAERIYTQGRGPMCPRDGYVVFRNSELLCGRLGKQTLGGGNKASLFQARCCATACLRLPCGRVTITCISLWAAP